MTDLMIPPSLCEDREILLKKLDLQCLIERRRLEELQAGRGQSNIWRKISAMAGGWIGLFGRLWNLQSGAAMESSDMGPDVSTPPAIEVSPAPAELADYARPCEFRICRTCRAMLPLTRDNFYVQGKGFRTQCKICEAQARAAAKARESQRLANLALAIEAARGGA